MSDRVETFRQALVEVLVPEIRQLKDEMRTMREELKGEMRTMREELKEEMATIREESNQRFAVVEQSIAVLKAQGETHQKLTQHVLDRLDFGERVATLESQMAMVLDKVAV